MISRIHCLQQLLTKNGKSPADKKVVRGSNVLVLTSHVGLNPRSKRASLSLMASLTALRAGYEHEVRVIKNYGSLASAEALDCINSEMRKIAEF